MKVYSSIIYYINKFYFNYGNKENNNIKIDEISSGCNFTDSDTINIDFKNDYLPKILCFLTTQNFFEEEEELLKQIYHYYLKNKAKKIPLEKIFLSFLCNIPLPPRGSVKIEYKLNEEYKKSILKRPKINELTIIRKEIKNIFGNIQTSYF